MYDRSSGSTRRLSPHQNSFSSPAWSPDGRAVAVVANGPNDIDQLYVVRLDGSERRLTTGETGVEAFAWRPDGRAIAFVRRNRPPQPTGIAAYRDAFQVTDNDYLATAKPQPRHLWLTTMDARERRLTDGIWSVANSTITWSPDGASLAYLRVPNSIHGISGRASSYALDLASNASRPLTTHEAHEDQIEWSPSGNRLLFLYPRDGDPAAATSGAIRRSCSVATPTHPRNSIFTSIPPVGIPTGAAYS